MKQKLLTKLLLMLLCLVGGASFSPAWADSYTITFATGSSDGTKMDTKTTCSTIVSAGSDYLSGNVAEASNSYSGGSYGLKLGVSGAGGTLKMNLTAAGKVSPTSIVVNAKLYNSSKSATLAVNGKTAQSVSSSFGDLTFSFDGSSEIEYILLSSSKYIWVKSVTVNYQGKESAGLAYETTSYTNILPSASFDTPTLTNPYSLTVTYSSTDSEIAAVNSSTGTISIGTKEGTATITASSEETDTYAAGEASYTITVAKGATTVTLSDDSWTTNILDGATKTLSGTPKYNSEAIEGAAVSWQSSNTSVATVTSGGVVTPVAPGTATITASYAGTAVYAASNSTCAVTVNKANTTLTLDKTSISQDLKEGRTVTLTPTVKAAKSDASEVEVVSPTITWTSSDETIATVSGGVVTGLKAGTATITASYAGGDNYNAATNATCSLTFTDTRTPVNISAFTAKTTLVIGDEQATAVTNDQEDWTATYTYTSSNTSVATVDENGVITAVAKGTATITATIKIALDETGYQAGTTASETLDITVTKPFHTVTFSVNGNTDLTASVEEDQKITFPTAVETTPGDNEFSKVINGQTFQGWYTAAYSNASVAPSYVNTASMNMGTSNVTYYAVFATLTESEGPVFTEITPSTENVPDSYGSANTFTEYSFNGIKFNVQQMYLNRERLQWRASDHASGAGTMYNKDPINKIQSIVITYDGDSNRNFTVKIGDSENPTSGTSITPTYSGAVYTFDCSSYNQNYFVLTNGLKAGYLSSVKINYMGPVTEESNFTTDNRSAAGIAFANDEENVKLTSGYTGQALTNPNSLTVAYSSSDATVATVNSSTGAVELLKAGTTTITATFAGNATYKPAEVSYTLNVTEKTPHGLAYADDEVEKVTTDDAFTNTLTNGYSLTISYSSSDEDVATVDEDGEVTIKGAGETTITATFAGDKDYEAGSASYTLTVSKATPTLSFTTDNATLREGEPFAGNALTNPAKLTVSYSSSKTSVATVDSSTGAPSFEAAGSTTITASFAGNDTYTSGSASYTLTVLAAPTIGVSNQTIAWDETFTVDDDDITGGDITVTSGNTSIATVDGLEITPVACGSVTITVSTAENGTYKEGSATFTLTITAPAGSTTVPNEEEFATLNFADNTGWQMPTDYTTTTGTYTSGDYSITLAGEYRFNSTYTMLKSGSTLTFPTFAKKVTKISVVGNTGASTKTKENIYVGTTAVSTEKTGSTGTNDFVINSSYQEVGTIYKLQVSTANAQITSIKVYTTPSATVTLNKYGYGTFCSKYPMDFTNTEGYTAWRVSSIEDGTITFTKITEKIKGGQGVLLYNKDADGENKSNVTVKFADGSTVFDNTDVNDDNDNLLVGVTADTYVNNGAFFGLSGTNFVPVAASVVPAGKALLPASEVSDVKAFSFVFEDDADDIKTLSDSPLKGENIYNLAGQRISKMQKGINIVNGRKVLK